MRWRGEGDLRNFPVSIAWLGVVLPGWYLVRLVDADRKQMELRSVDRVKVGGRAARSSWLCLSFLALAAGEVLSQSPRLPGPARTVSVAYLGAFLGDVTEDRLQELKLTEIQGAVVGRVVADSPAEKAGLKVGDVLLRFRGELVEGREHFYRLLTEATPFRIATMVISRDGVRLNVHVTLSERRGAAVDERSRLFSEYDEIRRAGQQKALEAEEARQRGDHRAAQELATGSTLLLKQAEEGRAEMENELARTGGTGGPAWSQSTYSVNANRHLLGVTVRPLNSQMAETFLVPGGAGVLVTEVRPGGLVERAGIKAGDCITALNGEPIKSMKDLTRQTGWAAREGASTEVVFSIVRDRREATVKANLTSR